MSRPKISLSTIDWVQQNIAPVSNKEALREIIAHSASVSNTIPTNTSTAEQVLPLHRIAAARKEQEISLTQAAQKLEIDVSEACLQEVETTDLSLSQLYRWREILDVPMSELVVEPEEIPTNPIRNRSQLVKMMKTVRAILEVAREERIKILAQLLFDQLVDLMPELKSIAAWPNVGQSREQRDLGQAAYRHFDSAVSLKLDVETL